MAKEDAARAQKEAETEKRDIGRMFNSEGDVMEERERKNAEKSALAVFAEELRKKELKPVNHATVDYLQIRKNFYVVPKSLAKLDAKELAARRDADEIKVRGQACPPPVESWGQCGLPDRVLTKLLEACVWPR